MAQPTGSQVHIDKPLTAFSLAYMNDPASAFIADKVFPVVSVPKRSDKYFTYPKESFFSDHVQKRGAGEESAGSGYSVSNDTFYCDVYALHKDISDLDRNNTDAPLDQDRDAATFLTHQLLLNREKNWADTFFVSGVWGNSVTPPVQWSNYDSSDPIDDVETAKTAILQGTGREGNTLVLGYQAMVKLRNHPLIIDRIKYVGGGAVAGATESVLAQVFGVDRVLVPRAIRNSNVEGKSSASLAFVHGKHALLVHTPKVASLTTPAAGLIFSWQPEAAFAGSAIGLRRMRMEHRLSDRIEASLSYDLKIVGADLGYMLPSCVA